MFKSLKIWLDVFFPIEFKDNLPVFNSLKYWRNWWQLNAIEYWIRVHDQNTACVFCSNPTCSWPNLYWIKCSWTFKAFICVHALKDTLLEFVDKNLPAGNPVTFFFRFWSALLFSAAFSADLKVLSRKLLACRAARTSSDVANVHDNVPFPSKQLKSESVSHCE